MKKSYNYNVRVWDKKGNQYYKTVTLTEGQNFFMVFYELMKKYNCKKFFADIITKEAYIPYPFRWSYFN